MTIMGQIREEATRRVNSMSLEIIEMAQKNLTHTRFTRLRKGTVLPRNDRERLYMRHLGLYVDSKMTMRHLERKAAGGSAAWCYEQRNAEFNRTRMDMIEFGLSTGKIEIESKEFAFYTTGSVHRGERGYNESRCFP